MKALVAAGGAFLLAVAVSPTTAQSSQWGCEVLLCLSNPGGPTQYSACQPPIERLWRVLERGGSFPSCSEANSDGYNTSRGIRIVEPNVEACVGRETEHNRFGFPSGRFILRDSRPVSVGEYIAVSGPDGEVLADHVWKQWRAQQECTRADHLAALEAAGVRNPIAHLHARYDATRGP